uniref:Uncharacterized protein n=2 Tax=Tanacetum cinerariifolium TaxID=118510 RepID=A0A699HMP2_TANCI|nr:hypothetical protein [Tanacetum cinerariifolium]
MSDHEEETINEENAHPKVVPQITTVTNIFAKFPYLKKEDAKSMTKDNDGNLEIRPSVTAEEHQQGYLECHQGKIWWDVESKKMQKSLLKQKFKEFKISEEEGLDKGYDKIKKILTQMNTLKINPDPEDVNIKFLRGLPPSWSEIDTKGYSSSSFTLSNDAFVSTARSSQGNLSYQESGNGDYTTSPGSSSSKGSLKSKCNLDQMNKEDFEEYDLKHQMAMLSIKQMGHFSRECRAQGGQNSNNYQKYKSKEAGKDGSDSKAMVVVDGSIDWDKQTKGGNTEPSSLENFGMIAGIKVESNADSEGEVVSADDAIPAGVSVSTGTVAAAVVSLQSEVEFAFMGLSTEVSIPVTCSFCCDSKYKLIEKDYQG